MMALGKENVSPDRSGQNLPPWHSSDGTLGLRTWNQPGFTSPTLSIISPNSKPALQRQRDHSACHMPDTLLKVRKTRENLRQIASYTDVPPPCVGCTPPAGKDTSRQAIGWDTAEKLDVAGNRKSTERHDETLRCAQPTIDLQEQAAMRQPALPLSQAPKMRRHKSVSRRMLSKVKQGIANRSQSSHTIRPVDSDTSLLRRISSRRKQTMDVERRAHSFDVSRDSVTSTLGERLGGSNVRMLGTQRFFTESTVSTIELLEAQESQSTPTKESLRSRVRQSSSPDPLVTPRPATPRPPEKALPLIPQNSRPGLPPSVPYVELQVSLDCPFLDINAQRNLWVAITATVRLREVIPGLQYAVATDTDSLTDSSGVLGTITSLRLCYKPGTTCHIRDIIGLKVFKNLRPGQTCSLFICINVPRIEPPVDDDGGAKSDQNSLFAELESLVGTLEMDVLHAEARYKHSLIHESNTITVRRTSKIRRPDSRSRWSICEGTDPRLASTSVHKQLAEFIAWQCKPEQALCMIERCLEPESALSEPVQRICRGLAKQLNSHGSAGEADRCVFLDKPSITISNIDLEPRCGSSNSGPPSEHFSTAPYRLVTEMPLRTTPKSNLRTPSLRHSVTSTSLTPQFMAPLPLSESKPPTVLTRCSSPSDDRDNARKIWRHIRKTSLSAQQLAEMSPQRLQQLESSDEVLKELRRRAIANKRSVGAETLKAWKWDAKKDGAEAPWL